MYIRTFLRYYAFHENHEKHNLERLVVIKEAIDRMLGIIPETDTYARATVGLIARSGRQGN